MLEAPCWHQHTNTARLYLCSLGLEKRQTPSNPPTLRVALVGPRSSAGAQGALIHRYATSVLIQEREWNGCSSGRTHNHCVAGRDEEGFSVAIYHFTSKIVSRANGQSVVASAAYRAAEELHDQRLGKTFDFTRKRGVEHTEILAPEGAQQWVFNREVLWNAVEQVERRKDAQLAREMEIALPVELSKDQQIALVREFSQRAFVSKGMVVDFALHRNDAENPHAHLLLTTRELCAKGFGQKRRDWNERAQLLNWREQWAEAANAHLLRAGHEIRIDHRTLEAQGIDLVPGRKIGISAQRQQSRN